MEFHELEKFVIWCSDGLYNGALSFPFSIHTNEFVLFVDDNGFCVAQLILYRGKTISEEDACEPEYRMAKINMVIEDVVSQARMKQP